MPSSHLLCAEKACFILSYPKRKESPPRRSDYTMAAKKTDPTKKKTASGGKTYKKSPANPAAQARTGGKSAKATDKSAKTPKEPKRKKINAPSGLVTQLIPFILGIAAVFIGVCVLVQNVGIIGAGIKNVLLGLFAGAAYTLPFYLLLAAFMWRADSENGVLPWKVICYCVTFFLTTVLRHFLADGPGTLSVAEHYTAGLARTGGGAVGGFIGELMMRGFDRVLSLIILFALLFLFVLLMFGVTPRSLWIFAAYKLKMHKEKLALAKETALQESDKTAERRARLAEAKKREEMQQKLTPLPENTDTADHSRRGNFDVDVDLDEDLPEDTAGTAAADLTKTAEAETETDGEIDEKIFDEVMRRTQERLARSGTAADLTDPAPAEPEEDDLPWDEELVPERRPFDVMDEADLDRMEEEDLDLSAIFSEEGAAALKRGGASLQSGESAGDSSADMDIELAVQRRTLTENRVPAESRTVPVPPPAPAVEPEYVFPTIDLLTADQNAKDENVAEELRENAARLVETLKNFNVRTKIVDVCRGPTITRYELAPEPGTKVRSIANLVDDIALNLATSGVRFEPSIPGKSAVGIEVPNKNAATVHLRTLLENPRFGSAKSRLTAALGQDVAGADVFLDVARMPHLLIAGATGQGKSVCINSLIVSLLFKAKPNELKFIMVDPKKVELNMYNGIPHLYMPVISDPKKAAGALSWAVSEMERRYSLIEEVGVRDLKSYNEITKDDPAYEFLPQFVIIIDELADLMMVAKNDVEGPICRIAQKARAAGMHLIIGTQRPSVDVITGLIKANFPSRISFRVSQLVDSRTILDRAGAESLIGRGDMLYSPVGSHEPMRVQGAFVSDEEVESVVEFIKTHNGGAEYNTGAIAEVERNAASIGSGKKDVSGGDGDDDGMDDDPMLRPAIELAVESGKISTSLIQRRLSLGYGRAAKLIDRMEQLGYVSAPEGQKPRDVLITKEQFMEMVLKDTDS